MITNLYLFHSWNIIILIHHNVSVKYYTEYIKTTNVISTCYYQKQILVIVLKTGIYTYQTQRMK